MESFEAYLDKVTAKGANIVPGAIMAVVDSGGQFIEKYLFAGLTLDRQLQISKDCRIRWSS